MALKKNRVGEKGVNNQGLNMEIISYRNNKDMDIKFEDGVIVCNQPYSVFISGEIKNNNVPNVNGKGYLGYGKYKCRINGKITEQYAIWSSMILRNYCPQYLERQHTYVNCDVCEEWLNFQNFGKWYDENKWTNELKLVPDKDILYKGNKEYNPNTVILIDQRLNNLFLKHDVDRGKLPIGVHFDKERNKYVASCGTKEIKKSFLGRFDNPIDAFNAYKFEKEKRIKQIANDYKEKYNLPNKIYNALMNYEVEITD